MKKKSITITQITNNTLPGQPATQTTTVVLDGQRFIDFVDKKGNQNPYLNELLSVQDMYIVYFEKNDPILNIKSNIQYEVSFDFDGLTVNGELKLYQKYSFPVMGRYAEGYIASNQ